MRYRSFMLLLYPEDNSHMQVLDYIIDNIKEYAFILHDKDYNEVGEIKKEHYHIIIKLSNAKTISALSKELKLLENYIEPIKSNYIVGLRYLIHADNEDKFQYEISAVQGTLKDKLKKSLDGEKCESDFILEILDIINKLDYIYISDFARIIATNGGLWSYYRRNAYIINQIISEHNFAISHSNKNLT